MSTTLSSAAVPTLPQQGSAEVRQARAFQLATARTNYNYMRSYLEAVPMSADLPGPEKFTLDYETQVLKVFVPMLENFKNVVGMLLERELKGDLPTEALADISAAWEKFDHEFSPLHPLRDAKDLHALLKALAELPPALKGVVNIPKDIEAMITGLEKVFREIMATGPTAFLKSTAYDMLNGAHGRAYLQPESIDDYALLFPNMPKPAALTLERQPWMPTEGEPCEQDWFFGQLQIGGFNTTQLCGVVEEVPAGSLAVGLSELLAKCALTDAILQSVSGDADLTLAHAVREGRLYVVDYAELADARTEPLHGEQRYITAPVAVFYWNPTPPPGFPPQGGLQPIAIQLGQRFDAEATPIFTPNDCAGGNDPNGLKWRLAKYTVNVCSAIQHEAVAHLGDTHLIVEPMIVAMHRQLAESHPLHKLLIPHFRFTININDDAIHSLIVPGGVVACNVGIAIESSLEMVSRAHQAWRWDEHVPARDFARRAVERLPVFPFRDDTLLLWKAIHDYVDAYLRVYYRNDQDVRDDTELQGWIWELTAPQYCGFKGLGGLVATGDPQRPWAIESLDYLIEMVALILYTAGPRHASVNYAQYPLMSYVPSVGGSLYRPSPTRSTRLSTVQDCLPWYPPLDIALYGATFEFLLSAVQYDTFGRYEHNPRDPYFTDPRVQPLVADLQDALALIEIEIRRRNGTRPMPYPFQLPSQIPNSISI
jgi:arachidonate 15-lipoxygenase